MDSNIGTSRTENRPHRAASRKRKRANVPPLVKELGALGIRIAMILVAAMLIFMFIFGMHYNMNPSMDPLVRDGDLLLFSRLDKDYKAQDLVILRFQGQAQVRRVIAAAGDTVDITESGLVINGALQQEKGIYQRTIRYAEGIDFPVTMGENEIFVLGDAREDATDSRIYGPVNVSDTLGKVITVIRRRNL